MTNLHKVITNTYTNDKIVIPKSLDKEIEVFEKSILISETDLEGIILYTNKRYLGLTAYTQEELIGSPHHIVRHPDMPKGVFRAMWKIISAGKIWRGYIKHLCKDGSYFWTLSYVLPTVNKDNKIIGYTSTGKVAYDETREEVEAKYKALMDAKHMDDKYFMRSENYYETQIANKDFFSEYIEELQGSNSK